MEDEMSQSQISVAGIALRTAVRGPMKEINQATAAVDGGFSGDTPDKTPERGITFLSESQWTQVQVELSMDLPWHTRRANVLLNGIDSLGDLIGKHIKIGNTLEIEILGETRPCSLMDQMHQGLQEQLRSDCRAGVHGRVLAQGTIHTGDDVTVM